jgi:hypothetical protein
MLKREVQYLSFKLGHVYGPYYSASKNGCIWNCCIEMHEEKFHDTFVCKK